MIHILNNLTEEYGVVLGGMEGRLMLDDSDSNTLIIEDIRNKLNNQGDWINERVAEKDNNKEDVALKTFMKQYKGTCNKCLK
jgi:hypothetical protein